VRAQRLLAGIALVVALTGCTVPLRYRYEEEQLGRRVWLVRAGDYWPGAAADLDVFVLYRAAERTRDAGLRYFAVREFTGDRTVHRRFPTSVEPSAAPPVSAKSGAELNATLDRLDFLYKTPYSELRRQWRTIKFRMLRDDEIGEHIDVVDGRRVLDEFRTFIDRRR
jgi:hypothetical protein